MPASPSPDPASLLVAHAGAMRRLARALVHDEDLAADVAQDAAVVALRRGPPAGWPPRAWLSGLVRNVARNARRGNRRRRAHEGAAASRDVDPAPPPPDEVVRVEAQRLVLGAVLRLEEPYRGVVIARYLGGVAIDEIAARSGVPRETVRTRLRRGVERLRADLDAHAGRGGWRAALFPWAPAPSGAPPSGAPRVPVRSALARTAGVLVVKKLAAVVIALLVLANAFSLWRVHALGTDVDRLEHRPEPLPLAADPAPAPAPAVILGARLGASAARPADEDLARRLAALEAKIDALSGRVRGLEQTQETAAAVLAEFVAARLGANETAAIATGRNVISAQAQFQMSAKCDVDADGTGEYGGFLEMSGADAGRMATVLAPPVLSGAFRRLQAPGVVERAGYFYRVFLPDARGVGVGETPTGFDRRSVDANLSETTWCLYAWPVAYGRTGTRTFFTNQGGDVLATDAPAYGGADAGPSADAAFVDRGFITGRVAIGTKGSDGNAWKQVN